MTQRNTKGTLTRSDIKPGIVIEVRPKCVLVLDGHLISRSGSGLSKMIFPGSNLRITVIGEPRCNRDTDDDLIVRLDIEGRAKYDAFLSDILTRCERVGC